MSQPLEPTILVIFGITGDLSQRYLLPALYQLFKADLLHEHTTILGLTRQDMTTEQLFEKTNLAQGDDAPDRAALECLHSQTRLLRFDPSVSDDYEQLRIKLDDIEETYGICMNRLYYLSIPPKLFETVLDNLGQHELNTTCQHGKAATRVLVEKPFGNDLASAKQLIEHTDKVFDETQVFRIDHYLAKEMAQSIMAFRSRNPIFSDIWDNHHISSLEILVSETIGIEGRTNFYEGLGALKDFAQNHLLQLLAVTTMDMPARQTSETIHEAKEALLTNIRPADPQKAIRGQYDTYREEVGDQASTTETYIRLGLSIDTPRWQNVPITLMTGKALDQRLTAIVATFTDISSPTPDVNRLTLRIQPNDGIDLHLLVKKPGFEHELQEVEMDFSYQHVFGQSGHPNAYEHVLVDAVKGDRTLFATSKEVLESWRILEPVLRAWQNNDTGLLSYKTGSMGPEYLLQ